MSVYNYGGDIKMFLKMKEFKNYSPGFWKLALKMPIGNCKNQVNLIIIQNNRQ